MAANSVIIPIVGASNAQANQFTAQSPSFNRYYPIHSGPVKWWGDFTQPAGTTNPNGITPLGFIRVEHHTNNQWETVDYYTSINGAAIATLFG